MTTLLASSSATGATATEGDVKTYLANLRTFMADLLGTDSSNKSVVATLLGSIFNGTTSITAAITITAAHRGKAIVITGAGAFSISITAAATLGDGFSFAIVNNSSGVVTIDPNLSETVNGSSTYFLSPTETVIVFCDGTKFMLFGKAPASIVNSFNGLTGNVTSAQAASAVNTANGGVPVKQDNGAAAVGSIVLGGGQDGSNSWVGVASGATTSIFFGTCLSSLSTWSSPSWTSLPGTWRNIGISTSAPKAIGLFQRIS